MKTKIIISFFILFSAVVSLQAPTLSNEIQADETSTVEIDICSHPDVCCEEECFDITFSNPTTEQVRAEIINQSQIYNLNVDMMLWVSYCESQFNPSVRGRVDSRDRGLWQINSYYHPEVSDECAFDYKCSTEWSAWWISQGHGNQWVCWKKYYNY